MAKIPQAPVIKKQHKGSKILAHTVKESMNKTDLKIIEEAVKKEYGNQYARWQEITIWMNALRVFVVLVFAGSIWGVSEIDKYVDSKIQARIQIFDNLPLAISLAEFGDWTGSAQVIDYTLQNTIKNKKIDNDKYKEHVLATYLWVLSSSPIGDDRTFSYMQGKWIKLQKEQELADLIYNKNDKKTELNITLSETKYNFKKEKMEDYIKLFNNLKEHFEEEKNLNQAAHVAYMLAMFNMINGSNENAQKYFLEAQDYDPDNYNLNDWSVYKNSYYNDTGYSQYERIAKIYNITNIRDLHNKTIESIIKK